MSPLDALLVINELNDHKLSDPVSGNLPLRPETGDYPFVDTSGDGLVTPLDALLVITHLGSGDAAVGFDSAAYPARQPEKVEELAALPARTGSGESKYFPSATSQTATVKAETARIAPTPFALTQTADETKNQAGQSFLINDPTRRTEHELSFATAPDGSIVAAWARDKQDGSGFGVFARRLNADGTPLGAAFLVNQYTRGSQQRPSVAVATDGTFLVAWESDNQDGDDFGIFARVFAADGTPVTNEFQVTQYTRDNQRDPAVSFLENGRFVITWEGRGAADRDGVFMRVFSADGTPVSAEMLVNQTTKDAQGNPSVSSVPGGGFVAAWNGRGTSDTRGVYARRFDSSGEPDGSEFLVNSTVTGDQRRPSVATTPGGHLFIAWQSEKQDSHGLGVFARLFDSDGQALSSEILVNETLIHDQETPAVTVLVDGTFVVSWSGWGKGDKHGVYVRRFDEEGVPISGELLANGTIQSDQFDPVITATGAGFLVGWSGAGPTDSNGIYATYFLVPPEYAVDWSGPEIRVNSHVVKTQQNPSVAAASDGSFIAVWESDKQDLDDWGIFAKRFAPDGTTLGEEFQVNAWWQGRQLQPEVSIANDGRFVVTWASHGIDGIFGVFSRIYDRDGNPLTGDIAINQTTRGTQQHPAVTILSDNRFVVAWDGRGQADSQAVFLRAFDAAGTATSGEIMVNTETRGDQELPSISATPDGGLVVTWEGRGKSDSSGVFARVFDAELRPVGPEFRVNVETKNRQGNPRVATHDDGRFVVTWESHGQDGDHYGIYAREFAADGTPLTGDLRISETWTDTQRFPAVAVLENGEFVVAWSGEGAGDESGVFIRVLDQEGNTIESERIVNTTTASSQAQPALASTGTGFVVTWSGHGVGDNHGVFSRLANVGRRGCPFTSTLDGWQVSQSGGSEAALGSVVVQDCAAVMHEGDSFVVSLERPFTIEEKTAVQFTYDGLNFDFTDSDFVNDAFEVALVDAEGNPLVRTIAEGRDAFFNVSEDVGEALAPGASAQEQTVTVGLNGIPAGTPARLIFRLTNDDNDERTTVAITDVEFIESDLVSTPPFGALPIQQPALARQFSAIRGDKNDSEQVDNQLTTIALARDASRRAARMFVHDNSPATAGGAQSTSGIQSVTNLASPLPAPASSFNAESSQPAIVSFADFSDPSLLSLNGTAAVVNTSDGPVLRLTPAQLSQAGSAFSRSQLNSLEFSTNFLFRITNPGGTIFDCNTESGADGLVFVIQSVSSNIGGAGHGIGYVGIDRSVGVEFDTWCNVANNDPSSNHIGIDVNGVVDHGLGSPHTVDIQQPFDDGNIWYAWVDYDGRSLEVRASQNASRPREPLLSRELDIAAIIGSDRAFVGFTSGTGADFGDHDILQWEFSESFIGDPPNLIISASSSDDQFPAGTRQIITGIARHVFPDPETRQNSPHVTHITVNGVPVDVLDQAGRFFTQVQIRPGENTFSFAAHNTLSQSASTIVRILGTQRDPGELDFARYSDITASFGPVYGRTSFNEATKILNVNLATINNGQFEADVPLLVGVTNIRDAVTDAPDPTIRVLGADGVTPEGAPYYDYSPHVTGEKLHPGQLTQSPTVLFEVPERHRFKYDLVFYGQLNQAPTITSLPKIEAVVGRTYTYDAEATDPDDDNLNYALASAPSAANINSETGELLWTPTSHDIGNHEIALNVTDGRGGTATQSYTLAVINPPPNRPPVITSEPTTIAVGPPLEETERQLNYRYDVEALDPDQDTLAYKLLNKPSGMLIDGSTGVISWSPTADQVGNHTVNVEVTDRRGGVAIQEYTVCVKPDPNNYPPTIISDAVATAVIGTPYRYQMTALDPDDIELTYFPVSVPDKLTVDSKTGLVTWDTVEAVAGTYSVSLGVRDPQGASDEQSYDIQLEPAGPTGEIRGTVFNADDTPRVGRRIVVAHDVNTLSSSLVGPDARRFAVNVANWLSGATSGTILAFEADPDSARDYAPSVLQALSDAGYAVTTTDHVNYSLDQIREFDVLFVGQTRGRFLNNQVLIDYVNSGGGVYLYGGVGPDFMAENGGWSTFLRAFGLDYTLEAGPGIGGYNGVNGDTNFRVESDHFIFDGVETTEANNGSDIIDLDPQDPRNQILVSVEGHNLFAVFDDEGDPVAPGWVVYLDHNANGRRDPDERFTTTDEQGNYQFTQLTPDTYFVSEESRLGWQQTYPLTFGPNLILNGSFEETNDQLVYKQETFGGRNGISEGNSGITHWLVLVNDNDTDDDIDWVSGYWENADGKASLDLGGFEGNGGISQTIETIPGMRYRVDFSLAGHPGLDPPVKLLAVSAAGQEVEFAFDVTGHSLGSMGWERKSWDFIADATQTTIRFRSTEEAVQYPAGRAGPVLDNVSVSLASPGSHIVSLLPGQIVSGKDFGNVPIAVGPNEAPTFISTAPTTATSGQLFRYDALAVDGDNDALAYQLPLAPDGTTVHPTRGTVVWFPSHDQVGAHPFLLQVTDSHGATAIQSLTLTVSEPNNAPVITSVPTTTATSGHTWQYRLRSQDADGDPVSFRLEDSPGGMTIESIEAPDFSVGLVDSSFMLTWPVPDTAVGAQPTVVVVADDGSGGLVRQTFTLDVQDPSMNAAPVITSTPRPNARFGLPWAYIVEATDDDGDALSYALLEKPSGMEVSPNGLVTWTPPGDAPDSVFIEFLVDDGHGGQVTQSFELHVVSIEQNFAPTITSVPKIRAALDQAYAYDPRAVDANGDGLIWSLTAAPRGMSIDSQTGTIRWTPDDQQLGTHIIAVTVTDLFLAEFTQRFELRVGCSNHSPAIVSIPPTVAVAERSYFYAVRADDLERDTLTFSLLAAPTDMHIDEQTGLIQWTPPANDIGMRRDMVIEANDTAGGTGTQSYSILVSAADEPSDPSDPNSPPLGNRPPVITSTPVFKAETDALYQYLITAVDPDGDTVTFALQGTAIPTEMRIDNDIITWTPKTADEGEYVIGLQAVDENGAVSTQGYLLSVTINDPPNITSEPVVTATSGAVYRYAVQATDEDGDPLTYRLDEAPSEMSIDPVGQIYWKSTVTDTEPQPVTVVVTDDRGQSDTQSFTIAMEPDTQAPSVNITVIAGTHTFAGDAEVDIGASYTVRVRANDNVDNPPNVKLFVAGNAVSLDTSGSITLRAEIIGAVQLRASATDAAELEGIAESTVTVIDPAQRNRPVPTDTTLPPHPGFDQTDNNPPIVEITSPEPSSTVTNLVPIIGTVDDPEDNLWYYRAYYARVDKVSLTTFDLADPDWTILREGTQEVINGELAVFDPSTATNDPYVIAVAAFDGNVSGFVHFTVVNVEGNVQVGNFHLEFTDLSIALAGIPIEVTRVYDTLQANDEGAFGFGWSLGVQDARILETIPQGYGFVPGQTKVYLTNPEGRRVGFTYFEDYSGGCSPYIGCPFGAVFQPRFEPDPGVYDSLAVDQPVPRGGLVGELNPPFNPSVYTLTTKDGLKYQYHQDAGLQTITDLNGNVVSFTRTGIQHSSGVSIDFIRDHRGRIKEIRVPNDDGEPFAIRYSYDATNDKNDLESFTNQTGLTTRYDYLTSPAHYLDKAFDPLGRKTLEVRYENGRFVGAFDGSGNQIESRDHKLESRTAIIHDGNGNTTTLIYDDRGNVIEERDALYDGPAVSGASCDNEPKSVPHVTLRCYDDARNPDLETLIIDRNGNVTKREYDARGNLAKITELGSSGQPLNLPVVTEFTYDSGDRVKSITNALRHTTSFGYDTKGNLKKITNAEGNSAEFKYDNQGQRTSFTDFNGNTTRFEDYQNGQPRKVTFADGTYQTFDYNTYGQVKEEAYYEPDGTLAEIRSTTYDASGRVTEEKSGQGTDPAHPATTVRRFYQGHLLDYEVIVNPESLDGGRLLESPATPIVERKSRITDYEYDRNDRLIRQIDAKGGVVEFRYDANGNRVLLQDPVENITTWVYDELNRVVEERDPFYNENLTIDEALIALQQDSGASCDDNKGAEHVRLTCYDAEGIQSKTIDRNGRRREFEYDHAGRLLEERWYNSPDDATAPDSLVETITFTYDTLGNMLTATDSNSNYLFRYDLLNRLTSVDNNRDGTRDVPHVILNYGYDRQGNVTLTQDSFGVTVESKYDARNRLEWRKWFDADVPAGETRDVDPARVDFFYNAAGREKEITRYSDRNKNNLVGSTNRTYDLAGRSDLLMHRNAVDELLAGYDYDYDFAGLLTHEGRSHQDPQFAQSIDYGYDLTGQLIDAMFNPVNGSNDQDDEHYEYDANGNRLFSEVGDDKRTYATDPANQLESDGQFRYEYDGEGNQNKRNQINSDGSDGETRTFQYDHRNRLVPVDDWSRDPGDPQNPAAGAILTQSVEYGYDAFGRRIARHVDADGEGRQVTERESFVYDGDNVWGDFNDAEEAVARYLFGNRVDQNLYIWRPADGNGLYLTDSLGTIRALTDGQGEISNDFAYRAFGLPNLETNDRFTFTGREFDVVTSLYLYRSRVYEPANARFLSRDPLGFDANDLNLYRYVKNSPTNATDPFGEIVFINENIKISEVSARVAAQRLAARELARRRAARTATETLLCLAGIFGVSRGLPDIPSDEAFIVGVVACTLGRIPRP